MNRESQRNRQDEPPTDDPMNGHDESESCWCEPRVEEYENGKLIIHQRTDN